MKENVKENVKENMKESLKESLKENTIENAKKTENKTENKTEIKKTEETGETENPQKSCPFCSGKQKKRDAKEFKDLMNRLKRIEGQVRGVEGMLENDAYCTDVLIQVSAITSALNSFNKALLANHMRTCVADNIRNGNDEIIDEFVCTLQKLMK